MNNTPETDSQARHPVDCDCCTFEDSGLYIDIDFARRLERERDAALIGYNECRATIEDARVALNAHEYEGLLLASLRIQDQLTAERALADRLAEALTNPATYVALEALTAWKEARGE